MLATVLLVFSIAASLNSLLRLNPDFPGLQSIIHCSKPELITPLMQSQYTSDVFSLG